MFDIILNPAILSVIILSLLCLMKVNVLLSLIISAIIGGLIAHMKIDNIMTTFINGMGANSETALSYILLGTFAAAMAHTGLANVLASKITRIIKNNKYLLILILTIIAVMSQNLIPIHIAFIPIIIPPLIHLMNKLEIDRRGIACALAFGLKAPYIAVPAGFGLIFQGLIADNMIQNGYNIIRANVWKYNSILGFAMLLGLLVAIFYTYRKKRIYKDLPIICLQTEDNNVENTNGNKLKLTKEHYITIFSAFVTLIVQLKTGSLPLGALVGLGIIFATQTVSHHKMDALMNEGVCLMGYVAFVMLVAAGFAAVLKDTGSIDILISSLSNYMMHSKIIASIIMLTLGLFITMGIGTSFGTIPILAVFFVPICSNLGLSEISTVVLLSSAAALGDAGSPASDTTLGPTSGLNVDNQHNHIWDTCIPTFLHFNIPLFISALIIVTIFK